MNLGEINSLKIKAKRINYLPLSKKYLILLNTLAYRITDLSEFVRWLCPLRNCPMRPDKFVWLPQNHVPFLH